MKLDQIAVVKPIMIDAPNISLTCLIDEKFCWRMETNPNMNHQRKKNALAEIVFS
jgi:type II secretory pathway predicted ATPase ExeA